MPASSSELRVVVGVEALEGELRDEVVERPAAGVLAVPRDHLGQRAGRVQHHVGLGLEERPVPVGVLVHRRERGNGRDVRVHEHAVAALVEPTRVSVAHRAGRYLGGRPGRPVVRGPASCGHRQATRAIATRTSTLRSGGPWNTPFNGVTSP